MSFAGIQATVNFYTLQEASLTGQLDAIMTQISQASSQTSELAQQTEEKKTSVYNANGSSDYTSEIEEIQNEYELKLSEITSWENQLEIKKTTLETELKATTSYKESYTSALKQNVQSDFKYGQNS